MKGAPKAWPIETLSVEEDELFALFSRCLGMSLSVGRAFDNDIILEDEYVSAHHLRLTRGEEGWEVEDLDSLNGVSRGGGAASNGVIRSGEELGVGHTTLRIFGVP